MERRDRPHHGLVTRGRYRRAQFEQVADWRRYANGGEAWFGFGSVRALDGLPPEILMIPLPGHTWGHAGIAIDTGGRWLLHAGDAYFYRGEVRARARKCTPGLRVYQTMMEVDRTQRRHNQARLRRLSMEERARVSVVCAHDASELEACQAGLPL